MSDTHSHYSFQEEPIPDNPGNPLPSEQEKNLEGLDPQTKQIFETGSARLRGTIYCRLRIRRLNMSISYLRLSQ